MLELIKKLCELNGVSGCEDDVRDFVKENTLPYADEVREDKLGNLLVFKKGVRSIGKTVMLAGHMDEVGVIIKSVSEDGCLKFGFVGGVDRRTVIGQRVFIGGKNIPGIIGLKAAHLSDKSERLKIPKVEEMYIDIGVANAETAKELVNIGDFGVFDKKTLILDGGFIKAKALDDRVGCAVMLKLITETPPVDTWFVFTVQEEVGARGAFAASFSMTPDIALVIESTTAADNPSLKERAKVCSPGDGVVIPFMDNGTVYDRELFEILRLCAEENEIPWQYKKAVAGGTDAAAIQRTKEGVRVAGIAAAVRYIHSPASVGCVRDFIFMQRLARAFLERLGEIYND